MHWKRWPSQPARHEPVFDMSVYLEKFGCIDAAKPTIAKPSLALIHGWGMHGGVWQPLLEQLSSHFCLHVIDLPGMGFSAPLTGTQAGNQDAIVEAVAAVLPRKTSICAWSFGGQLAMQLAQQYSQRVDKLVLVGATPKFINHVAQAGQDHDMQGWQYGMPVQVFEDFASKVERDYQDTLLKFLTLQCMRSQDARNTVRQLRDSFLQRPAPDASSLQHNLTHLLQNDLRLTASQLTQPTLVLHGDRDTLAPVAAGRWLASHIPSATLEVIDGASHAPFLSHPQQFTQALTRFLLSASIIPPVAKAAQTH